MNKRLFIVRHAKSSWDYPQLSDFERPLNKRGKRDVPDMSQRFLETGCQIDLIMSSPAERALITAKGYAARLGISSDQIEQQEDLYHASTSSIRRIISNTNNKINALMLFGHNPGFTYLINDLSDFYLDNLPTCAICGIQFEIDNWSQIIHTTGKKFYYDYPKS